MILIHFKLFYLYGCIFFLQICFLIYKKIVIQELNATTLVKKNILHGLIFFEMFKKKNTGKFMLKNNNFEFRSICKHFTENLQNIKIIFLAFWMNITALLMNFTQL